MATNGSDSPNSKDRSEIRPGMKREFAMMMKNQSQFLSIGRTRSSKSPIVPASDGFGDKRARISANLSEEEEKVVVARGEVMSEEEEPKSGIVDFMSDDDKRSVLEEDFKVPNDVEGDSGEVLTDITYSLRRVTRSLSRPLVQTAAVPRDEAVEKNVAQKQVVEKPNVVEKQNLGGGDKRPKKLKELLETGLLEGLGVRYIRGTKVRMDNGLNGIIRGDGILCFCDQCGGTTVVSPIHFELHAGSANKRPPEYIYLENGRTLRDVLNACKDVPLESVTETIKHAIGSSAEKPIPLNCRNCRVSLPESGDCRRKGLCVSCNVSEELQPRSPQQSDMGNRSLLSPSVASSSDQNRNESLSRSKGKGRLTRKDLMMHRKGFEELVDGAEVSYFAGGQKVLDGYKKGSGIFCLCCNSEVSPSQFEAHAGYASRRKPYLHIYTSNGVSLHEWAVKTSLKREISAAENDDLCSICVDGGDLLCCDTCPRAFHPECLSLQVIPEGKFHCRYCKNTFEKEKFVERNANAVAAGRVSGADPIEEITRRCIRIVEAVTTDLGGCVLCRGHDFSSGFNEGTVIICDQCDKEYHVRCLKEHNMEDLKELPTGKWFCCTECTNIYSALENMVAAGDTELSDSLMNVIKKKHEEKGSQSSGDLDIKWRLLCGKTALDETRVLLSNAVDIFHEQFGTIANSSTREFDYITNMVNGKSSPEHDFGRMYCALLTVNSSVASAGLFRIFNQEVAELPLVATGSNFQGLGYFQSLFSCIESLLRSVNVKDLVLPSADEAKSIWTKKFGFERIDLEQLNAYRKKHHMMVFQGTSMLHKPVCQI